MGKQLFGTDGIRGVAGEYPLDPATVYAFGVALGTRRRRRRSASPEILIGADTRESGTWIAELVAGGLESCGARVRYAGVITTPGVAYLTRTGPFCAGVMISASHNPYRDNGIKVFGHSGFKLPDDEEHEIEQEIFRIREQGARRRGRRSSRWTRRSTGSTWISCVSTASVRLRRRADRASIAATARRTGWRPELFRRLGAEVVAICTEPDGRNINLELRRAAPGTPAAGECSAHGADFGVAFDGDADRAIFVARSGKVEGWRRRAAGLGARAARHAGRLHRRHRGLHRDGESRPGEGAGARGHPHGAHSGRRQVRAGGDGAAGRGRWAASSPAT